MTLARGFRISLSGWARVVTVVVGLLALPALSALAAPDALQVLQPDCLSTLEATPVHIQVTADRTGPVAYTLTLSDEEDEVRRVLAGTLSLEIGPNARTLWLDPRELALFSIGETAVVTLEMGGLSDSAEATVSARAAGSEASGWAITFSGRPAQVYTTRDAVLALQVTNPKTTVKSARIKVKFLNAKGKNKGKAMAGMAVFPGENDVSVTIPASLTATVKAKAAVQAKAVLLVGGEVKASETVPVDYDLAADASASPMSGVEPLFVSFSGSATGGTPSYAYAWDFGDGAVSSEQNPDHTFVHAGTYDWILTVTDAVNGTVAVTGQVAVAPRPTHLLTVTVGIGAAGLPLAGTTTRTEGDQVPYAYTAVACYGSLAVTLDGSPVPASGSVTMDADHNLSATAALSTYVITATAGPGGTISPAGVTVHDCGASQAYTIAPSESFFIQDVQVDGASVGTVGTYTFTGITADHTIAATFSQVPSRTLTVALATGTSGTPGATATYPQGTVVSYAYAVADACYEGLAVLVDGVSAPASGTLTMDQDHSLSVTAALKIYTIGSSAGAGGSIAPVGVAAISCGGSQTYTITPLPLFYIADVQVDGASAGAVPSYTFSDIRDDHTIAAAFSAVPNYTLGVTLGDGVTGSPAATATYPQGTAVNYSYGVLPCYDHLTVTVDGHPAPAVGTITMDADHQLVVSTDPITYALTVDLGTGTTGTPAASGVYACGRSVDYAYALVTGHKNLAVTLDGVAASAGGTVAMNADHHLAATASPITFTITASVSGGTGTINPSGAVTVAYSANAYFTFTAGIGTVVGDVLVDGVSIGHPDSYNFVNVLADHTLQVLFVGPLTLACSADPSSGIAPLQVSFTATPAGGNSAAYTYAWDFGDGATSTAKNPGHIYAAAGVYAATVTVQDGLQNAQCETPVTVGINHAPSIVDLQATPPVASLGVPSTITFTLDDVDPGDAISWSAILTQTPVSIGVLDVTSGGPVASGTGVTLHYTVLQACPGARAACEATIQITATDTHGGTSSQSVAISIQ